MSDHAAVVELLGRWPKHPCPDALKDPCAERVRQAVEALDQSPDTVGVGDLAGLIGHYLKREGAAGREARLRVPRHPRWPDRARWESAGLAVVTEEGASLVLRPGDPWSPVWLAGSDRHPPLLDVFRETPRRSVGDEHRPRADPCLTDALGERFARFTGAGQRQAVQAAFLIPPGETLLVVLPTGSGKSLVGFAPAVLGWPARGLTLFVVPTVALALDLTHQARELIARVGADVSHPLAWHAGLAAGDREVVKRAVRDGTQTLLFASPEAVVQGLSPALFDAAERGLLRGVVIDECHLVAQWGNDFRPEFQSLAGLWAELRRRCPPGAAFRTTLLTATLTQESYMTLRTLFGDLRVASAVHLRPEPSYWVSKADTWAEQRARVLEACRQLPRPFLLYVTTRADAARWAEFLNADGMRRVRHVHGGSPDRAEVLGLWRANRIDAVVATSAFGLGVDKGDVRAVVHACVPETVDRFYQEVGRGGRDGRACVSVAVYTDRNLEEATGLNRERVISTKLGLERWEAMFATRPPGSERDEVFPVDLRAKRAGVKQDNDANVGWNLQTLNLMARSGLVRLHSAEPPEPVRGEGESSEAFEERVEREFDGYYSTARVETLGGANHRDPDVWEAMVQTERGRTAGAGSDQLELLEAMLAGRVEFADALECVYSVSDAQVSIGVEPVCGGCPVCRAEGLDRTGYSPPLASAQVIAPRPPAPRLPAAAGAAGAQVAVVTYRPAAGARGRRRWADLLLGVLFPRLIELGVREIAVPPEWVRLSAFRNLYRRCSERYLLYADPADHEDRDAWPVPRVTLIDPFSPPAPLALGLIRLDRPFHLMLVPDDVRDPERPTAAYRDRYPTTPFDTFMDRLER